MQTKLTVSTALLALCASNVLAAPYPQDSSTTTPPKDCYVNSSGTQFCGPTLTELKSQFQTQCANKMFAQIYPPTPEEQACLDLDRNIKDKEALEKDRAQYQYQCADKVWPDVFPPVQAEQNCINLGKKIAEREGLERMKNQYREQCADKVWPDIFPPVKAEQECIDLKKGIEEKETEVNQKN